MPGYIHTDRASNFRSDEVHRFLFGLGIPTSRSSPYHATGNSQSERFVGLIWRTMQLQLHSYSKSRTCWAEVLPEVLFSLRSLLCTATNETPHDRLFKFPRRFVPGMTIPTWLLDSRSAYLRRFVRNSKYEPLVDPIEIVHANPSYSHVRFPNGRIDTVSNTDLSPAPPSLQSESASSTPVKSYISPTAHPLASNGSPPGFPPLPSPPPATLSSSPDPSPRLDSPGSPESTPSLRRSTRISKPPNRLHYDHF